MEKVFGCKIEGGKLVFTSPSSFREHCKTLIGKELVLTLSDRKKKRSLLQNNYYWGVIIKILSEELGYETEEMHEVLKSLFIPPKEIIIKGIPFEVRKSTSKLNKKEFMEYKDAIQRWAASMDIYIPDPNEFI